MRLLFDENLSPRLVRRLEHVCPGSRHIDDAGLKGLADRDVWEHAGRNGFILVSKDNDFRQLAFVEGAPPKVVWLSVGNAGTAAIAELLIRHAEIIQEFERDPEESLLVLTL